MATFKRKIISDQQFLDICREGYTQGVIEAINSGANVNAKDKYGYTALMLAAENGHIEIVNTLIKAGTDIKNDGRRALRLAASKGHTEIVNALINAGADVKNDGASALIGATENGHTEIVNALIEAGADLNAKDKYGMTALMCALNTEIVNALIEAGADDLTNKWGQTALIYAAGHIPAKIVNALIDAGLYVKQKDNFGRTALDYARERDCFKGTDALKRLEELSR